MMGRGKIYGTLTLLTFVGLGLTGCDNESNVENPDLDFFVKYYGIDGDQRAVDMAYLDDGTFLLLGNSSSDEIQTQIYVVRADAEGDVMWSRAFTDEGNSIAKDLEPTDDGNFIILADYQNGGQTDFKLLKISPDGSVLSRIDSRGTPADEDSHTVTLMPLDGGFIVSGTTDSTYQWTPTNPGKDPGDTFAYRFDRNLNPISSKSSWSPEEHGFGAETGAQLDVAVRTIEILEVVSQAETDTAYYVFGHTSSNVNGNNPNNQKGFFYFRRGKSGTLTNVIVPGNLNQAEEVRFVDKVPEGLGGGVLVIGTSQVDATYSEMFIARLRSRLNFIPDGGDLLFYKTVPLNRNIRGVAAAASLHDNAGYLVAGDEVRSSTGKTNIWLSKIDQSGRIIWSSTFGSENGDDNATAVVELADGKVAILGTVELADNQTKMALLKVNTRGQLLK